MCSSQETIPLSEVSQLAQKAAARYRQNMSLSVDGKTSGELVVKGLPKETSPLVLT